ncbi:Serine/threonine-protein kinase Nek9 [Lamellibrachia satsuma]|nr:Serine/threonine-protein kinase Nek9 [Lamellibrachia satsuma]
MPFSKLQDASKRPTADDILKHPIFSNGLAESMDKKVWELDAATRRAKMSATSAADVLPVVTSKCSEVYIWGGGRMTPQKTDMFTKGRSGLQVSAGHSHLAVITVEKELYTWSNMQGGGAMVGQLGQGDTAAYKAPKKVETFENIPVRQVSCGDDFTVCVTVDHELLMTRLEYSFGITDKVLDWLQSYISEQYQKVAVGSVESVDSILTCGVPQGRRHSVATFTKDESDVYAFGSDYDGCLGCDGEEGSEVCTPKLINFFSGNRVHHVSCGNAHVVALTEAGDVFTWGCGEFGRLGLGSEDDFALPQKVETRGKHAIKSVHAGSDGTFIIRTNGRLLACGSNEDNKLGFNSVARGLHKRKQEISYDIPYQCTFTTVKPLSKHDIETVAPGKTHTAIIDSLSRLITFGSNKFGQLGVGDYKVRSGVNIVSALLIGKQVLNVSCGDGFTVASTSDNQVYSWGLCENGRLGTVSSDTSKKVEVQCYALPRPIFGSLHAVTDVASHYWSTILVAEKVLAQKTIGGTRVKCTDDGDDEQKMQPSQMNESSVPTWLQRELAESEVRPGESYEMDSRPQQLTPTAQKILYRRPTPFPRGDNLLVHRERTPTCTIGCSPLRKHIPRQRGSLPVKKTLYHPGDDMEYQPKSHHSNGVHFPVQQPHRYSTIGTQSEFEAPLQVTFLDPPPKLHVDIEAHNTSNVDSERLYAKIENLEMENKKLQELVSRQGVTIKMQADTISHMEDKVGPSALKKPQLA